MNIWMPTHARWVNPGQRRRDYHRVVEDLGSPDPDSVRYTYTGQVTGGQVDPHALKASRLALGLSVADVARAIGTTSQSVYEWERGDYAPSPYFAAWWEVAIRREEAKR